ncbi:MAG: phosphoglucomutase/phosphomannomutase family protein [Elusimicrobia bacterium]|nr:phosphoglucomutase/phosphomannomutase family protein [Elusimicrobiota bacterium]
MTTAVSLPRESRLVAAEIHFGTDGWRAIIADDFTFANVRRVAHGIATYLPSPAKVLVGYDNRFQSEDFAKTIAQVLAQRGLSVVLSRTSIHTPTLSANVVIQKAAAGVMVTASHNPPSYNGIKIKDQTGRPLPEHETRRLEALLHLPPSGTGSNGQTALSIADFLLKYLVYLRRRVDANLIRRLRGTVIVDAMHGVGAGVLDRFLGRSVLRLHTLHPTRDPLFGGHRPEPVEEYLTELLGTVKRRRAHIGIALDGDADRVGIIDDQGRYLTPHQVFPLLVWYLAKEKGWKGKVVQAVSLGYVSERIARTFGLPFEEVPVGFKFIAERMVAEDVLAGGEESGGYGFRGGIPERDGILCGLLFLEMLAATGQRLSQRLHALEGEFGRSSFLRRDLALGQPITDKTQFAKAISQKLPSKLLGQIIKEVRSLDGPKIILSDDSWLLLRPSGTEPLLRTYAESPSRKRSRELLDFAHRLLSSVTQTHD